jgi:hypothetical protein
MGSLSGQLIQSVFWRMSHTTVIINKIYFGGACITSEANVRNIEKTPTTSKHKKV